MNEEARLIAGLRRGDEWAFRELIDSYGAMMLRVARTYVRSQALAEEIVQETWMAVLAGVDRFEARSSLKTWILRILTNRAKSLGRREARIVPFSSLGPEDEEDGGAVDAERFLPDGHSRWPGHWTAPPADWRCIPQARLVAQETLELIQAAIDRLPARQQQVLVLRDVEGWDSEDVCAALGLSEGNQRVLLHRARSKVRAEVEPYMDGLSLDLALAAA
jgi:RNA polymerase sigma-70 factor, ECF subfamily